ncbi:MAG: acyltransferase [Burkholderiales bacterium]|nr:acyltransferase [Burkholderiales bacterium]
MNSRLHKNNFDLLRFLFAGTVFLVHAHVLSGHADLQLLSSALSSEIAVRGFFVVSGILVFMSYERSRDLRSYAEKRLRRIYPAYFFTVMLCAVFLVIPSEASLSEYFSLDWLKYVLANLAFLNFIHPTLPGVFPENIFREINGALWTLKIEVMFYATIPLIVFACRRLGRLPVLIALYIMSAAYVFVMTSLAESTGSEIYSILARQLPGQMTYFVSGALIYYYLDTFEKNIHVLLIIATGILVLNGWYYPVPSLEPLALAVLVSFFGFYLYAGNFGKHGDYSYGIYILHFPVLQVLIQMGLFEKNPYLALAAASFLVLTASALMWNLVEKRFLLRSSHYIASEQDGRDR